MGAVGACECSRWGMRSSPLQGHETCERCAEMGAVGAWERKHWGLRWSSLWSHETCERCAEMGGSRREEVEEAERRGVTRGAVSSKRGPNTTGWLGKTVGPRSRRSGPALPRLRSLVKTNDPRFRGHDTLKKTCQPAWTPNSGLIARCVVQPMW